MKRSDSSHDLVHVNEHGLYCPRGDFYIDPWRPVETALITHAHSDHARVGAKKYFSSEKSEPFVRHRLGADTAINGIPYGEKVKLGQTWVSFHPAGVGSSRVDLQACKLEYSIVSPK